MLIRDWLQPAHASCEQVGEIPTIAPMSPSARRARPTLRCLSEDLGLELPSLDVDLGTLDHPMVEETRRIAPESPQGQKRILNIDHPLVYRLRVSGDRGATWVDEEHSIVWLCAARRRQEGSEDDAFSWFAELHKADRLLPTADDLLRDRAEAVTRLQQGLTTELLALLAHSRANAGQPIQADLGGWMPARLMTVQSEGMEEVWCGLSVKANDSSRTSDRLRDVLFASLEVALQPAEAESRADWPGGEVPWTEVVRFYVRAVD